LGKSRKSHLLAGGALGPVSIIAAGKMENKR
jgi:hypothetical protein